MNPKLEIKGFLNVFTIVTILAVAAIGFLVLSQKSCEGPIIPKGENSHYAQKNGQTYFCQTYFEKLINKLKNFPSSTQSQVEQTLDTSGWKTHLNYKYGFEFKYPGDWALEEASGQNYKKLVISITSPQTKESIERAERNIGYCEGCGPDIAIYYSPSVREVDDNYQAISIDELIDLDPTMEKIGVRTLAGQSAIEVQSGGFGLYYQLFLERNGEIFTIFFNWKDRPEKLTLVENQILSTFKFTPTPK